MNDTDLDDILRTSRPSVPIPASFQREVWNRIEHETPAGHPFGSTFSSALLALSKPWLATTGMAAALAMGAWIGSITAPTPNESRAAYAQSISPFLQDLK
jgi:hypothetical protein